MPLCTAWLLAAAWRLAAASAPAFFDCTAEYANWEAEWSASKKEYCCQNSGLGCEATTTTSCSVDCSIGLNNWEAGWSTWKKEWCCKHEQLGCPSERYQCDVGDVQTWPANKQAWCCKNKGVCRTTTTSCHVDCQAGLNNWEAGWATYKKEWCCKHEKLGCPRTSTTTTTVTTKTTTLTTTPTTTTPTTTATVTVTTTTAVTTKTTPTTTTRTSATTTTATTVTTKTTTTETTLPYNCKRSESLWTADQREWCCKNEHLGCVTSTATTSTTLPYDCFADYTSCYHCLERRWPYAKRSWCCEHVGRGCTTTKTSTASTSTTTSTSATVPYDCGLVPSNQTAAWSSAKRAWCCAHESRGCTTTATTSTATTVTATATTTKATTVTASTTTTTFDCNTPDEGADADADAAADATAAEKGAAAHSWSSERRAWCCEHKRQGCPTTSSTTTTTTRRVPDSEVMTCDLNCYGADPVPLPGSVGAGKGASLNDVSLQECRNICAGTKSCEGVLFTNRTRGVPWKSMCFGKRDIRTSKCQPGGSYLTELIGQRPWGKCAVFGDPHVITWDRVYGPPITMTDPGEYYLVKSKMLSIHGRFGYTRRFPTASSTVGIALGGPMIGDHNLVVAYVGPESGFKGFQVFWDGKRILEHYPSTYTSEDGILRASHDAMDPLKYHREGRHTIGGTEGLLPSYYFQLKEDLNVYVLLGPDNCNAVIETRKTPGEQDGYCGNFNCNKDDDDLDALRGRGMADPIPEGESLFKYGKKPPAWVMTKVAVPSIKDCDPRVKAKAAQQCKGLPNGEEKACIFDACAANSTEAAGEDVKVLARAPEEAQGCDRLCNYGGLSATCEARIRYAALNRFQEHEMPCLKAHELVLRRCSSCSNCSSRAVGCTGSEEQFKMRFQRLYTRDTAPDLPQHAAQLPVGTLLLAGLSTALVLAGIVLSRRATHRARLVQEGGERVALLDGGLQA